MAAREEPNADSPTAYIVMGHGLEDIGQDWKATNNLGTATRIRIPKGVTVVTVAQCGISTIEEEVCPFLKLFTEDDAHTKDMLTNPTRHLHELEMQLDGKPLHVFTEGDYLPEFAISYFARFPNMIYKSGVFPYPIKHSNLVPKANQSPDAECPAFAVNVETNLSDKVDPDVIKNVYKGSAYPPIEWKEEMTYKSLKNILTYEFKDVFDALPKPAIYYYVICRSPYRRSPRTVFKKNVKSILHGFLPEPHSVEKYKKLASMDERYIEEQIKKMANGADDALDLSLGILPYMKEHPETVPESLDDLFKANKKPYKRDALEDFRETVESVERLFNYDVELIKDKGLKDLFIEYKANFSDWRYDNPIKYIDVITRRRRGSNAQQAKYRGAAAAAAAAGPNAAGGHGKGGGRRRVTRRKRRAGSRKARVQ